jgi:NADH-quinone oxidoreductase subunit J
MGLLVWAYGSVVRITHPFYAALALLGALIVQSMIYTLLNAPFIATMQLLVYAGAIMVLFLFVVMMMDWGPNMRLDLGQIHHSSLLAGLVWCCALVGFFTAGVGHFWTPVVGEVPWHEPANILDLGSALLFDHALEFEAVSVLLLTAAVAAITIAHPQRESL